MTVKYKKRIDFADSDWNRSYRNIKIVMGAAVLISVFWIVCLDEILKPSVFFIVSGGVLLLISKLHEHKLSIRQREWVANLTDDEVLSLLSDNQVKQIEKDRLIDLLRNLNRQVTKHNI